MIANGQLPADPRAAAGYYLDRGLLPISVPRTGNHKNPALDGWSELRPRAADLDALFPPGRALNLGLLLGTPSRGLVDVDLDCAEAVAAGWLLLPRTGWISGRPGRPRSHYWYTVKDPPALAAEKYEDLAGGSLVELRSTGGHTVAPPGVHESGEPLAWDRFEEPGAADLGALRIAMRRVAACALLARHWPGQGSRQDAFLALAGGLLRGGLGEHDAGRIAAAVAAATNDEEARKRLDTVVRTARQLDKDGKATGWPKLITLLGRDGEVVVARVREWLGIAPLKAPAGATGPRPRAVAPYRPFPTEAMPQPVREYVVQAAAALGCDPAFVALPALAAAASAVGNSRVLRLKRTWSEPCVVWSAIVADSGTLKSPAFAKAVGHLQRVQKRLLDSYREQFKAFRAEYAAWERARKDAARGKGGDLGDPPAEPRLRRVVCGDTTIEKLALILEDSPRGTLAARDELSGWLGSFTRYKGRGGGTDLPNWLEMHRAGTVMVDRKTGDRPTLFIPRAAVSVTGGIQPGVLARALTADVLDAGLAARLLLAMPVKKPKRWTEAEVTPGVQRDYESLLERLLELELAEFEGEAVPVALTLDPAAKELWVAFYDAWAQEQAAAEGELAAAFSKLEAYAARLALLHHVVTHVGLGTDDRRPVGRASVEAGIALCRWFAGEARRIYGTVSESTEERDLRHLVEFVRGRGGRVSARDLQSSNSRKYPSADLATAALQALVDAGLGAWEDVPTTSAGGRPTKVFVLCPTPDPTDGTADEDGDDPGDGGAGVPDDCPDRSGPGGRNPAENEGSVGTVERRTTDVEHCAASVMPGGRVVGDREEEGGCVMQVQAEAFVLVTAPADLGAVAAAVEESVLVALDTETTGLDPRTDRVRLLALNVDTVDGGRFTYLIDCFVLDPAPLWEALAAKDLVLHNAAFDLAFLAKLGFAAAGKVHDTMPLAQLLAAGTFEKVSLEACAERHLGLSIDKAEQKSDWSRALTASQLEYAARDAAVLPGLLATLTKEIDVAGLTKAADVERRCLPAIVWMAGQGAPIDAGTWRSLAARAGADLAACEEELKALAPPKPGALFADWNWGSSAQVQEALAAVGIAVTGSGDAVLAGLDHPLAAALRRHRDASKRASAFGEAWLAEHVGADGRVYPSWRQLGASSGRMSCSDPNMQQLPRGEHRKCVAAPPGRVLVKADYSQIELRIAAKVSGDAALLAAYRAGEDLHTKTARNVLGVSEVTKDHRQLAKALNFGLLYGMGARGFRGYARTKYGVELTEAEAVGYRSAFFQTYPGLARWHRSVGASGERPVEARTLLGRRVRDVRRFSEKLNAPVQGTGADGLKAALALLWERRTEVPSAFPVLAVHDEIVVECDEGQAEAVTAWLKQAMLEAMAPLADPVPVEVEAKVGRTWGG
jgi:DNA polymerase-1